MALSARRSHLHVPSPPPEAQQLLVLAGDEVDGSVLQQRREDEEQADGHPDVDGFDVGHLVDGGEWKGEWVKAKPRTLCDWIGTSIEVSQVIAIIHFLPVELYSGKRVPFSSNNTFIM